MVQCPNCGNVVNVCPRCGYDLGMHPTIDVQWELRNCAWCRGRGITDSGKLCSVCNARGVVRVRYPFIRCTNCEEGGVYNKFIGKSSEKKCRQCMGSGWINWEPLL